jgi:hypothetical protein
MKTMTCKQLGGACDVEFKAETFDEIAQLSQQHGNEMFQKKDEAHLNAMNKMQKMIQAPNRMQEWMDKKRNEFNSI